ncbi:ligand-gated ion channel [Lithospermum erythrorhizon]|uniref:Ligand-gated ion channel n=1 Tax=Lithospermum erythrorhizon TaxID=34254 RepID=A0AAV3R357_LITER
MEVEAFALTVDELKFVASQFRRLHSRQVQHTFRFYSQQWRTWAACFIQAAWRRYSKRKLMELQTKEEEAEGLNTNSSGSSSYSLGATILACQRPPRKPPEPDFTADAD